MEQRSSLAIKAKQWETIAERRYERSGEIRHNLSFMKGEALEKGQELYFRANAAARRAANRQAYLEECMCKVWGIDPHKYHMDKMLKNVKTLEDI